MILDNNILFSLMKPDSVASKIFAIGSCFSAPEFVKVELEEYDEECRKKSRLTKELFEERKKAVFSRIKFVAVAEYKRFLKKALQSVDDVDDVPYVALAMATGEPIWSNDPDLKGQKAVVVLTTEDMIKLLS